MIDWSSKNIDLGKYTGRTTGHVKVHCPECHDTRHNKADKSLSCNLETGFFRCHHCGWHGFATVNTDEEKQEWMRSQPWYRDFRKRSSEEPKRTYDRPPKARTARLSDKTLKWFKEKRGISEQTLTLMRVTDGEDWMQPNNDFRLPNGGKCHCIHFNYYRNGELIATKLRSGDKCFRQAKANCEQIAYNLDGIKNTDDCYIVEGEMDALSLAEIGYTNVVSVPDGGTDKSLHWLVDYYEEYFANKKTIYICSDNDNVGTDLCHELAKHFDPGSYVIVSDYGTKPDGTKCKDANDCLVYCGPDVLRKKLDEGKTVRPEGDADMDSLCADLDDLYENGLPPGLKTGISPDLDRLWRIQKGRLNIITGTPGSGKSQFLDMIAVKMHINYGWRFSMFSPEMMPLSLHLSMLVSKLVGKPFDKHELPKDLYQEARDRVKDLVHFIDPENYELDTILAIAKYQVRKYGCDGLIIDPWNDLMQDGDGITKTDDINTALLKILTFAQRQDIAAFVMAHPTKQERKKDGTFPKTTLNDISGGAHFRNRADAGIVLIRHNADDPDNTSHADYTEIVSEKQRFPNLGKLGTTYLKYQVGVGRFHPYDPATDTTQWDERNYLDPHTAQTPPPNSSTPPSNPDANPQGLLAQMRRADQAAQATQSHPNGPTKPNTPTDPLNDPSSNPFSNLPPDNDIPY